MAELNCSCCKEDKFKEINKNGKKIIVIFNYIMKIQHKWHSKDQWKLPEKNVCCLS